MSDYLNSASREINAKVIQWRGNNRNSVALFSQGRAAPAIGLDSLLEVMSPQIAMLGDQMIQSVLIPHQKYATSKGAPELIRNLKESDICSSPEILNAIYGVTVTAEVEILRSAAQGQDVYSNEQLMPNPQRARVRPTLVEGVSNSQIDSKIDKQVDENTLDPKSLYQKIKALRIPPVSPNFGSLCQPSDGRKYK